MASEARVIVTFRLLAAATGLANEVVLKFPSANVRESRIAPKRSLVAVPIQNQGDADWIANLVRERGLDDGSYEMVVSVESENDSEMSLLPEHASSLFRRIGGRLEFAYTLL